METEVELLRLAHSETTHEIIGAFFQVYNAIGPGLAEVVYQRALVIALDKRGLAVAREVPLTVWYDGRVVGEYRADLIVASRVLVETKAVDKFTREHSAQVYSYLKIARLRIALLLNFGPHPAFRRLLLPASNQFPA